MFCSRNRSGNEGLKEEGERGVGRGEEMGRREWK